MRAPETSEGLCLEAGAAKLKPLLTSYGFEFAWGEEAVAHQPYVTAFFRRGKLEIGLIVRNGDEVGCPNYSEGRGYAGHTDMFWALGRPGQSLLVSGSQVSYEAKDGGDPFDALLADLETVILPALEASSKEFSAALALAHKRFQDQLFGKAI